MNTRLRPDYLDPFTNVARLICSGDAPPWLAEQLWCFNRWLYQDRHVEEILPTRARTRSNLRKIEEGSFRLALALQGPWVQEFLDGSPDGPVVERRIRELEDLSYRAGLARNCPALATKSGATRPGPGRAEPHEISLEFRLFQSSSDSTRRRLNSTRRSFAVERGGLFEVMTPNSQRLFATGVRLAIGGAPIGLDCLSQAGVFRTRRFPMEELPRLPDYDGAQCTRPQGGVSRKRQITPGMGQYFVPSVRLKTCPG